jgi:tetratricopeptide (TPR) repeat protein
VFIRGIIVVAFALAHAYSVWAQAVVIPGPYGMQSPRLTPAQQDWWARNEENLLSASKPAERPIGERISVVRLLHKPPHKAVIVFEQGLKFALANSWTAASLKFERAVSIDAEFSEAHGNLGAAYAVLQRFDEAALQFRRAIELDPSTAVHHANLAYVLMRMNQPEKAEPEARSAIGLDPSDCLGHYVLGFLLARMPATNNAAIEHLVYAERQFPEAHFVLAEVYFAEGNHQTASMEMEAYRRASEPNHGNKQ